MSKPAKYALIAMATITVVLVGLSVFRRSGEGLGTDLQVSASEPAPSAPVEPGHSTFFNKLPPNSAGEAAPTVVAPAAPAPAASQPIAWQAKVDETLASQQPEADKARQLLALFPQLPPDAQEEVAQHLTNLLPDADFALLNPYLTNSALPEDVSDVLLDDVLNRPNSLKLPALLEIARTAQHPKAAEAKDFLELFLDEDYGDDWGTWQTAMQTWLADNPD